MTLENTPSETTGPSLTDLSSEELSNMIFQTERGLVVLNQEVRRRLFEKLNKPKSKIIGVN
jgi:hypothetical protein